MKSRGAQHMPLGTVEDLRATLEHTTRISRHRAREHEDIQAPVTLLPFGAVWLLR